MKTTTLALKFGRRTLLHSAAAAVLTAPFHPRRLRAAETGVRPLRFITFFNGCGNIAEYWDPQGTETDFKLNTIMAALEPWQRKLVVIKGLTNEACRRSSTHPHHKAGGTWLNPIVVKDHFVPKPGPSLDQLIAETRFKQMPFASVQLGVLPDGTFPTPRLANTHHISSAGVSLHAQKSPYAAFDRLFAGVMAGAAPRTGAGDARPSPEALAEMELLRVRRASILDRVKQELGALSSALGGPERAKFEQHLTLVRELEARLQPGGAGAVDAPVPATCTKPSLMGGVDVSANDNIPVLSRLHMDVLVAALVCDRTRVASLMHQGGQSQIRATWLGIRETFHHDLSHAPYSNKDTYGKMTKILTWHHGEMAYLLRKLDGIQEGAHTMLDNTLALFGNELGNASAHSPANIPVFLAGGAAGKLRTGRFLTRSGVSLTNLHRSIAGLFGVAADRYGGDTGTGTLDGFV